MAQYIVLDLEWNQPWPGSSSARKNLPIHGEIIQIGAVRLSEGQPPADEFQILVKPTYYRRLNGRISKLTGIKESALKREGLPFPDAIAKFREWCGEDYTILTWGYDDIMLLRENLEIHDLPTQWIENWYNAQVFFSMQHDGTASQRALKTAMEQLGIAPSRPAHDALGDAYHTALICQRLDLQRGKEEYRRDLRGTELPGCVSRKCYEGYADKRAVLLDMGGKENVCPQCGAQMQAGRWVNQQCRRYSTIASCPEHGMYLVRVRLVPELDGKLRVNRLVYSHDSEAAKAYEKQLQAKKRSRCRRRRKAERKIG